MKVAVRVMAVAMVLAMLLGLVANVGAAEAAARTASWVVSVTYQNVGTGPATILVEFYGEGSADPLQFTPAELPQNAGASFFIGNVTGLPQSFRGSAVMSSNQPLVATVVQFSPDPGFKMRLLSNGFQAADGASQYMVATTLKEQFSRTTVFSIQNTESVPVQATVRFYDANNSGALAGEREYTIPGGSSEYVEMDVPADTNIPGTGAFNGSAIVTAVLDSDGTTPANVVAAASELYINRDVAANFEGVPVSRASGTLYMATALCRRFGLDTYYAVQNASLTDPVTINVEYRDQNGAVKTTDGPYTLGPGGKQSITTCAPSSAVDMSDFTGSAVITTAAAEQRIVAIGKAQAMQGAGAGTFDVFTAFMGEPAGASKLALPFVRWASDANFTNPSNMGGKQRTYIAIQNLGSAEAMVDVKYNDKNGATIATQTLTIAGFAKGNSDANAAGALGQGGMNEGEFGYYTDGSFGGAVVIEANAANPTAQFIAIARVQHPGAGEDYNAVPVQ
jgi:hypothetical protein